MEKMETKEQIGAPVHAAEQATEVDNLWLENERNEFVIRLRESGLAEAIKALPGFRESFKYFLDTVDCSDGRVLLGNKFGIAGSGILLSGEDRKKYVEAIRGLAKVLTSHDDCGAAKALFAEMVATGQLLPDGVTTADELGKHIIAQIAKEVGAEHIHLSREEMAEKDHDEFGIVVDGTAMFSSTKLEGFPPHFVCSGAGIGLSDGYIQKEITMLSGIAFGGHGFGQRLSAESPFHVIVIARDEEQKQKLFALAQEAVASYGDRVKVDAVAVEL